MAIVQMMQMGLLLLRPLAMLLRPMHDGTVADGADGWAFSFRDGSVLIGAGSWGPGAPGALGFARQNDGVDECKLKERLIDITHAIYFAQAYTFR